MSNAEVAPEATDTDQTGKTLSRKSQTMRQLLFPDMLLQLVGRRHCCAPRRLLAACVAVCGAPLGLEPEH